MTAIVFTNRWTGKDVFFVVHKQKSLTKIDETNVGVARFELTISWSQTKRDTGLRYTPKNCSPILYQRYRAESIPISSGLHPEILIEARRYKKILYLQQFFVIRQGIEPRTVRLEI